MSVIYEQVHLEQTERCVSTRKYVNEYMNETSNFACM